MEQKSKPLNLKLYNQVKKEIYDRNPVHSLYRSAQVVKEYKRRGGLYENNKDDLDDDIMNLKKWFKQKWISANDYYHDNEIVNCGNSNTQEKYGEYPLCRPKELLEKMKKPEIKKLIDKKNKLKSDHLITENVLHTKKYNIKNTNKGI
jgi:hypothetical protein